MSPINPGPSNSQSRRQFLTTAASLSGMALLSQPAVGLGLEPIVRNRRSHLKLSLAAYSFRDQLGGSQPSMTMLQFIERCAEYDVDGCELTSYWFPQDITVEYLNQLKQTAFRLGLDISGTAIRNDFCLPSGPDREHWLQHTRRWIDFAATFGAPVIRVFAGVVPKGETEATAVERCVAGLQESLEYAAQRGVYLALENHGGITATADQLLAIVQQIDSPWLGINLDSGNFSTGGDPYEQLSRIAPYAINAQIKTDMSINGRKEPADLGRIVQILRDAAYRGYVVLEYEGTENPVEAVPRHLQELRKLISE